MEAIAPLPHKEPTVNKAVEGALTNVQKKLFIAIALCSGFMLVELVAGIFAHSLAILTDAAHMLSDVCSFAVSLFAIHISAMPGTVKMSFGYARAEILGALMSVLVIWGLTIWLVAEALNRIFCPVSVKAPIMVYTALFGIVTNIALTVVLDHHGHHHHHHHRHTHHHHEHSGAEEDHAEPTTQHDRIFSSGSSSGSAAILDELPTPSAGEAAQSYRLAATVLKDLSKRSIRTPCHRRNNKAHKESTLDCYVSIDTEPTNESVHLSSNVEDKDATDVRAGGINITAAYLHALGDLLQNLGVLIGGLLIWWKPHWTVADPICTLVFSVIVFSTTIGIIRDAANVLMEGTPAGVDPAGIVKDLRQLPNVSDVHDVHVWSLSMGKPALACHVVIDDSTKAIGVLASATSLIQVKYMILHTTIQIDFSSNKSSCETDAHVKCH